jgi:hypothetical protein
MTDTIIKTVIDSLTTINGLDTSMAVHTSQSKSFITSLSGGIGYEMFFYALIGSLIHFLFKIAYGLNDKKTRKEPFYLVVWLQENIVTLLISILCGLCTVFFISQWWQPVTITKSIIGGILGGTAMFNLYPIFTNPDMWKSIGVWIVNKFVPGQKNNP